MKKVICMIVTNSLDYDNRVKRAAEVVSRMGHDVHIICYSSRITLLNTTIHHFEGLNWPGPKRFRSLLNLVCFYLYAIYLIAAKIKPEIFHLHDYDTLILGWLSLYKRGVKIIYDNHEYVQDLKYLHRYPIWLRKFIAWQEVTMIGRVSAMVVVSNGIRELYLDQFRQIGGHVEISVIRNIPHNMHDIEVVSEDQGISMPEILKKDLIAKRNSGVKSLLYLGANLSRGRGLHHIMGLLKAMPENCYLYVFGEYTEGAWKTIMDAVITSKIDPHRVHRFPSYQIGDFKVVKNCFDWGLSMIEPIYTSYYYSLPNKFFEYIMLGVPVVSTDIPEQRAMIDKYKIGYVLDGSSYEKLAREMLEYIPSVESFSRFIDDNNWSTESQRYVDIYYACSVGKNVELS